jgi:hypothetical protein
MEKVSRIDRVRNEKVLHRVKDESNIHTPAERNANWFGHILHRNCLIEHFIKGKKAEIIA